MTSYIVMVDLAPGVKDLDFTDSVDAYLGKLVAEGKMVEYFIQRRTFGFSPPDMREFLITMRFNDLTQMDSALNMVATRAEPIEGIHAAVYSKVVNFKSALYRDFPDAVRVR